MIITGLITAGFWATSLRIFWNQYATQRDERAWEENPDNNYDDEESEDDEYGVDYN